MGFDFGDIPILGDFYEGLKKLGENTKSDFTAYAPPILGQENWVPSAYNQFQPLGAQQRGGAMSLRDALEQDSFRLASSRTVPLAQRATAAPLVEAGRSSLNLGLLAPGMAVTQGALANDQGARLGQVANLRALSDAASGAVPSAAEKQMQAGLGQTLRGNLALAASARGTPAARVAAQRAAANANAEASANVLGQTAALRAQEQAAARQLFTGAMGEIRGQDLSGAQVGLGLGQTGASLASAQLGSDTQTQLANLQARTGITLGQLTSDQATNIANMDATLRSRGMDDTQRIALLGAALGIDASQLEGQMALQKLVQEGMLKAAAINAATATANAQTSGLILGGIITGGSNVGAAGAGAG